MSRLRYLLIVLLMTLIGSPFLMAYTEVIASDASDEIAVMDLADELSILDRYQQVLLESIAYYRNKIGFEDPIDLATNQKITKFPVLLENDLAHISHQPFYSERYFSRLFNKITKPRQIESRVRQRIVNISNAPVVSGYLSSPFGMRKDPIHGLRRMHTGIDIAAEYGSIVNPLGSGEVVFAGIRAGYGNTVDIKHGSTVLTRYAHLKQFFVDKGQKVDIDDEIGTVGLSGRSTGSHLHLEVLFNGKQVDPQVFLANHFGSKTRSYYVRKADPKKKVATSTKIKLAQVSKLKGTNTTGVKSNAGLTKNLTKKNKITKQTNQPVKVANVNKKQQKPLNEFPQITYQDYVKSVDGLFGFTAPKSFSQ